MHGDVCKSVYCHWDGYLEHNGKILLEHYNSVKANYLVAKGSLSSLGPNLGQAHPFSKYDIDKDNPDADKLLALHELAEQEGWCTFYGRDRGETDVEHTVTHTFADFLKLCDDTGAEYYYILKDDVWYCGSMHGALKDKLVELKSALANVAEEV
jgi:hypothetical protein